MFSRNARDIPFSRAKRAAVEQAKGNASTLLLVSSTASVCTAAVAAPIADEGAMAVAGDTPEHYSTTGDRSATSSATIPELVEEQKSNKEPAPAVRSTAYQ